MALAGDRHRVRRIVNADVIAGGLSGTPELSAVEAGRIALRAQERYIAERLDFALETTLSGRRWDKVLNRLDNARYQTTLYYLWLDTPDLAVARVRTRVMKGGHGVTEDDVRRRYGAGLVNLLDVVTPRVDAWHVTNATTRLGAPLSYIAHGGRGLTPYIADHAAWEGLQRAAARFRRDHPSTAYRPERP
jgi:predicted ABC-type ATPase